MGDTFKGRLVYVNILASACLAFICIIWPFIDVAYGVILTISIGKTNLSFHAKVIHFSPVVRGPQATVLRDTTHLGLFQQWEVSWD